MIKKGSYVRIGKGRKVYEVSVASKDFNTAVPIYYLNATAKHPDAAVRVSNGWKWYRADELTEVEKRCHPHEDIHVMPHVGCIMR